MSIYNVTSKITELNISVISSSCYNVVAADSVTYSIDISTGGVYTSNGVLSFCVYKTSLTK